ncbi:uncharacterized protein LOC135701329 [Ochlerotatus camptorhynchus]|uniref:uncharacterized protein LOC135701329 n=1 Tax=Ochlerotatus camptorhynchus TaxID=644619 RepID=UPI0031E418F9
MVSLLQLDIEPCEQQDKPGSMTSIDWKRPALEILLKLYHEHPILYDMRHPKYYAKAERQKALSTIIDLLEDHRPGTTTGDILKKIQTMRTQFGQEYGKVRKAQAKGTEYVPTIWWYQHLSFLRKHIKPRAIKEEMDELQEPDDDYMSMSQNTDVEYENYTTEEAYELESSEIVYEIQSSPSGKGSKEEAKIYRQRDLGNSTPINGSGKEEIIYEITNSNTIVPKRKIEVISAEEPSAKQQRKDSIHDQSTSSFSPGGTAKRAEVFEITVEPDRSKSFGQFVASQIAAVKDDYLFYSTQMEVLNVINKAQLKQLQMDKDAASK